MHVSVWSWLVFIIVPVATVVLLALIFWIWMIIDCLARDYRQFGTLITSEKSVDKLVWVLLLLFLPIIGAVAYHIAIRRRTLPGQISESTEEI